MIPTSAVHAVRGTIQPFLWASSIDGIVGNLVHFRSLGIGRKAHYRVPAIKETGRRTCSETGSNQTHCYVRRSQGLTLRQREQGGRLRKRYRPILMSDPLVSTPKSMAERRRLAFYLFSRVPDETRCDLVARLFECNLRWRAD